MPKKVRGPPGKTAKSAYKPGHVILVLNGCQHTLPAEIDGAQVNMGGASAITGDAVHVMDETTSESSQQSEKKPNEQHQASRRLVFNIYSQDENVANDGRPVGFDLVFNLPESKLPPQLKALEEPPTISVRGRLIIQKMTKKGNVTVGPMDVDAYLTLELEPGQEWKISGLSIWKT